MVKAKAEITISKIIDIEKTVRYYLLQSSTSSVPSKPTTNPPGGNWVTAEPSYTTGSTNTLYFVDLTIMSDDSFSYSAVSKSSSYEAAKAAYNKAVSAESSANSANSKIDGLKVGGRNLIKNGKGNVKAGFFKNFPTVTDEYAEITLKSKKTYSGINLNDGFVYECREYDAGEKYTWSYDIMYTNWNFPTGSNRAEFWMGQRYTIAPSGETATGTWSKVTQHNLPVVGQNGCELNKWYHVKQTVTIPDPASSNVKQQAVISFYNSNADVEASFTARIKNVKLEKGTIATDWAPAPEDLETRVTNAETQISSNKEAIDLRATKTEVTTAKNDAIKTAEKYSDAQLTTKANAITSTVTELSKDYNGYKQSSTTAIQNAQGWQLNWDKILNGKEANTNKHTDYITFKDGNIKLGDSASTKTLDISNEDIQIRNGEDHVASFGEHIILGKVLEEDLKTYTEYPTQFKQSYFDFSANGVAMYAMNLLSCLDGTQSGYGPNGLENFQVADPVKILSLGYYNKKSSVVGKRDYEPKSYISVNDVDADTVECKTLNANRVSGCYQNNVDDQYFETPVPLYVDGYAVQRNNYHIAIGCNTSVIRLRNDGNAFYIMNGDTNSWTNYITFFTDGTVYMPSSVRINSPGHLYIPSCTKAETTSAANAFISSDGNGVLAKTSKTSSRRFKDSITPELDEDLNPERLYDVDVIQFKYKEDYFTNEDDIRYRKNMIGLIAEDVYDKYKIAADWHVESGEVLVDGWNEQYIIPALLKLIQNQHKELQEQRTEIDQLKETVDILMKDYKERQSK